MDYKRPSLDHIFSRRPKNSLINYLMEEDILWLQVPVNDFIIMHEFKSVTDLFDDRLDLGL